MNESPLNWPRNYNPTPQIEGKRPGNLLPQKFTGWPAGRNRAANEAEELLSSAVAYWDASAYRDGDRFLRNLGVGGEALDLRLGSSTLPNSNDPQYLAPEDSGYVYLPGVSGNYLSVPDENALDLTGDIDIRYSAYNFDSSFSGGSLYSYVCKHNSNNSISDNSYSFSGSSSRLYWRWRDTLGNSNVVYSGICPILAGWAEVRVTFVISSGQARFYYREAPSASWIELTAPSAFGATTINSGSLPVTIGSPSNNNTYMTMHKFQKAQILNGIDGIKVLDIDCNDIESASQTNFSAKTGQIVQINRSTSGRKSVAMPSKKNGGQPRFLFGTDDYMEVQGNEQHQLLNFDGGNSFSVLAIFQIWNATSGTAISKVADYASGSGWFGTYGGDSYVYFRSQLNGGLVQAYAVYTPGSVLCIAGIYDQVSQKLSPYVNNVRGFIVKPLDSTVNRNPVRIGATTASPFTYINGEFLGAAIFRRALTQQEIQLITNYFQNRKTFTYTIPSDTDQKAFMASRLGVSSSVSALDILKDAPFYIDSRNFTDGSQYVQNLGWRRDGLNMRLGSSNAADTNDPKYLVPESSGYVYLPGITGNRLTVPDEVGFRITGDIDLRAQVALTSWTPSTEVPSLVGKYGAGGNRGYALLISTTGNIGIAWSPNGTTEISETSTTALNFPAGRKSWIRATLDVDNGASGYDVNFYTSEDGLVWTQLGSTVTKPGVTSIYPTTETLEVGSLLTSYNKLDGKVFQAQVLNGINGTTVLNINCNAITSASASSFAAITGQTVTINRPTFGRKTVAMPSISNGGKQIWLFGTDDYMVMEGDVQHSILGFDKDSTFTILSVARTFNNSEYSQFYISKRSGVAINPSQVGWSLARDDGATGSRVRFFNISSPNFGTGSTVNSSNAASNPSSLRLVGIASTALSFQFYNEGVPSASRSSFPVGGSWKNTFPIYIGYSSVAFDAEVVATAIWLRELSAAEISTLNAFFTS